MSLEKLGRYEITGKLGEGAMGIVYRAFDPVLERIVAVKTIKFDLTAAEQADFSERFFREAKSAARLSHPGIVTVFDAGETGDIAYMAMEVLEGKDLRDLIVKGDLLPVDRVADIVAQVADALDYAHRHGVVHRDIKPANIMVLDNGAVKIADFGIAQLHTGARTMTGQALGSPKYMSPEQIEGHQVDGRADIFSLGAVLYQMLTGVPPFDAPSVSAIMYRVINRPALLPSLIVKDLPRPFEFILAKALAKQPDQRYQTAAEMAADLRRYRELKGTPDWEGSGISESAGGADAPIGEAQGSPEEMDRTRTIPVPVYAPLDELTVPVPAGSRRRVSTSAVAALALIAAVGIGYAVFTGRPDKTASGASASSTFTGSTTFPASAASTARAPRGRGTVDLAVTPWGEIFVDGKSAGVSPPLAKLSLPAGQHKLEIRNGDFNPYRLYFDLQPGGTQQVRHRFK